MAGSDILESINRFIDTQRPPSVNNGWMLLLYAVLPVLMWLYTAITAPSSFPTLKDSRILLLIAHPDDEAMFFSPTLTSLTNPRHGNRIKILCLSSGDADGLGGVRPAELAKSAKMLGVEEKDVVCLDMPELRDGMKEQWDAKLIAELLLQTFSPESSGSAKKKGGNVRQRPMAADKHNGIGAAPAANLDAIITFDEGGVSGHANHKACLRGAKEFLSALLARAGPGWDCPVALYTLSSVSMLRKYAWAYDVPLTVLSALWKIGRRRKTGKAMDRFPSYLMYISGVRALRKGQRAMVSAHKSQMVWFRWGWIGIGRYMIVNDLRRVDVEYGK